jgi:alkylated DNA nucleotide flippase Atl1
MLHNRGDVPAHRVVNRNGLLTGKFHFDGTNLMQQLLESEGIVVVENQIIDFEKHFLNQSSFSISINGLLGKLMSFILE